MVPFVKRAEELEKETTSAESKIMAYYCRLYVVTRGSKMVNTSDPAASTFLLSQMTILETTKPKLGITTEANSFEICKIFALTLFKQADEEDRGGIADKGTAKLYYSSGTFFDVLEVFKDQDVSDIAEMKKYGKWRATEILGAIKQGLQPDIGGFGELAVEVPASQAPSIMPTPQMTYSQDHSPTLYTAPPATTTPAAYHQEPPSPMTSQPYAPTAPAPVPGPIHTYNNAPVVNSSPPTNNLDTRVQDSIELCSFALSALKHNELALARERLQEALRRLE